VGIPGTGKWEDVTPPGLSLAADFKTPAGDNYGAHAFVVDPQDNATVYLGTSAQGIFKTTDCGAHWTLISHGDINNGRNGSMVIDPIDRNVLYTDGRYGVAGLWKTSNGGVDWTQVLPADTLKIFGDAVEWISMDPTDHLHLVVSPHFTCKSSQHPSCLIESKDGGATWAVIDNANVPDSTELGGQVMLDAKTWLVAQPFGGLWRTTDAGANWVQVLRGGAAPYIYQSSDGSYFMPGSFGGILHSVDHGASWTGFAGAGLSGAMAVTSKAIFSSIGLNDAVYSSAPLSDLTTWTVTEKVPVGTGMGGWMLGADRDHNLVYSSNFRGGFWRYSAP